MYKSNKKSRQNTYAPENLILACEEIRKGGKLRETCRLYGVPKSTVLDRLKGRVTTDTISRMGPDPVLSEKYEEKIVQWLTELAKCGFPLKKEELLDVVQKIVIDGNLKTPFNNGRPGQKWFSSFLKRHPTIKMKSVEALDSSRAKLTKEFIKKWFNDLKEFLQKSGAADILDDSSRILNADESGFSLCPKTGKVLGLKGHNTYVVKKGNEKENLTVLVTFTGDGRMCHPVVVFPYVRPPKAVVDSIPEYWILGKSESGWMRSDVFYEFVANGLNSWLTEQRIKKPVLFLVDGHRSHLSLELSQFCDANGIILYAFPPNATHLIQPADVSVFKPMKEYWRQYVREWQIEHNKVVTKSEFCPIFKKALEHPNMVANIKSGFKVCGLCPFNPDALDYSKCVQNTLEELNVHTNKRSNFKADVTTKDIESAEKVISVLKAELEDNGVNVEVMLNIIESLKAPREDISETIFNEADIIDFDLHVEGFLQPAESENEIIENASNIQPQPSTSTDGLLQPVESENRIIILHNEIIENASNIQPQSSTSNDGLLQPAEIENQIVILKNEIIENSSSIQPQPSTSTDGLLQSSAERENRIIILQNEIIERPSNIQPQHYPSTDEKVAEIFGEYNTGKNKRVSETAEHITQKKYKSEAELAFKNHLRFPKPLEKRLKTNRNNFPSAISSKEWRKHYDEKLKQKEEKENSKNKRKRLGNKKKSKQNLQKESDNEVKNDNILEPTIDESEILMPKNVNVTTNEKQICGICDEILDSDAEDENEKNVGCDVCPRWYHLGCTHLHGLKYCEVKHKDYLCDFCRNES